ncbi:MAG: HAD-IA family hydrolase [Bacteroidales bacterium]
MNFDIKPGVKGLIFDLDGTLVDSMPYHFEGWQKACNKFGARIDTSFLRLHTGSPGWMIAEEIIRKCRLNSNITIDDILKIKIEEFQKVQHLIKPIKPVVKIVKKYHGVLPMAVGTGGHRDTVEKTLEITDLKKYFDIVVTSNDVANHKPDPETFLKCAELMKVEPHFIEVFEDGDLGIEAAKRAGMIVTDVREWFPETW